MNGSRTRETAIRARLTRCGELAMTVSLTLVPATAAVAVLHTRLMSKSRPSLLDTLWIGLVLMAALAAAIRWRFPVPSTSRGAISTVLLIGLGLRLLSVFAVQNAQTSDFQVYHELATAIAEGKGFSYTGEVGLASDVRLFQNNWSAAPPLPTAFRPPGAPLLYGIAYSLTRTTPLAGEILNALLGTATGILIFFILGGYDRRLAFSAALIWQLLPSAVVSVNLICSEVAFTTMLVASAASLTLAGEVKGTQRILLLVGSGIATGCATLIRPATHLVACGVVAVCAATSRWRRCAAASAVFLLCALLPPGIYGLRNMRLFGTFQTQPTEIGVSLDHMTRRWYVSERYERTLDSLSMKMMVSQNEFELARVGTMLGTRRLFRSLLDGRLPVVWAKNHLPAWGTDTEMLGWCSARVEPGSRESGTRAFRILGVITETCYLFILVFAVAGAFRIGALRWWRNPGLSVLFLYTLSSFLLSGLFRGQARHHYPLMVALCILAAHGMATLAGTRTPVLSDK